MNPHYLVQWIVHRTVRLFLIPFTALTKEERTRLHACHMQFYMGYTVPEADINVIWLDACFHPDEKLLTETELVGETPDWSGYEVDTSGLSDTARRSMSSNKFQPHYTVPSDVRICGVVISGVI